MHLRPRDRNFGKNFGGEHANALNIKFSSSLMTIERLRCEQDAKIVCANRWLNVTTLRIEVKIPVPA